MLALTLTRACQLTHQEGKVILRLRIVDTWKECGSLRETARRLSISRNTVRKWVRHYQESGEAGLMARSRRPHHSPRHTPPEVEERVLSLHRERGWGRRRVARSIGLPEGTVRHNLRRHLGEGRRNRKKRKTFYPAHWAWEEEDPFQLVQVDTKRPLRVMGFKVRTVAGFLRRAQRWQHYYNVKRPHFGAGMEGKSPLERLRELGFDLPDVFAAFPVIPLDEVAVIGHLRRVTRRWPITSPKPCLPLWIYFVILPYPRYCLSSGQTLSSPKVVGGQRSR